MDLEEHLKRQMAFSRATFGPGPRTEGVIDHIRKELVEIAESGGHPSEWVDVVILGLDGLWRSVIANGEKHDRAASACVAEILEKQGRNEQRDWPDWRTAEPGKAIEHVRIGEPGSDMAPTMVSNERDILREIQAGRIQYPVNPRLLPSSAGYICDACGRTWKVGETSGCEPCITAVDARSEKFRKARTACPTCGSDCGQCGGTGQ